MIITSLARPGLTDADKVEVVAHFLNGKTVTELAVQFACRKASVEHALREAVAGLSQLNKTLLKQQNQEQAHV